MGTLLSLRFSKDLPTELAARLGAHCRVSGPELSVFDIEHAPITEIAKHIIPFNRWLIFGPYFVPDDDGDYMSPDVIGAVLGPGEVQGSANLRSDFDPAWPAPCFGVVKQGITLECHWKPKGHVEMIGDNLIFSKQLIRLLGLDSIGRATHAVQWKGKLLNNWSGFSLRNSCSVLLPICFGAPKNCTLCQTSYKPWRGVWVGNSPTGIEVEVCTDVIGYEHNQSRHPVVLSKALATTIEKVLRGKGFNLEPIFSVTSEYGKLIALICSYFRREDNSCPSTP